MKHSGLLFLIFALFLPVIASGAELKVTITYTNNTPHHASGIRHRLTIPPDTQYQKIKDIKTSNIKKFRTAPHKNGVDKYISFGINIEPYSTTTKQVIFTVEQQELSFSTSDISPVEAKGSLKKFIRPSKNIESDAREIKAIAKLIEESNLDLGEQVESAYVFPDSYLKYSPQENTTALTALKTATGDCTEFAYLFVAICRNLGVPARVISGFFVEKKKLFSVPNHHATEIYSGEKGWLPVFPNLGNSEYKDRYGFGKISKTFITLKRGNVWTWSNSFPKGIKKYAGKIKAQISWEVRIGAR